MRRTPTVAADVDAVYDDLVLSETPTPGARVVALDAFERRVGRVHDGVVSQTVDRGERPLALRAFEWPLARVTAHVDGEGGAAVRRERTLDAFVLRCMTRARAWLWAPHCLPSGAVHGHLVRAREGCSNSCWRIRIRSI